MVVFPNHTINGNPIGMQMQEQQNYYDNPTVDPIYENLDDYGVTGGGSGGGGSAASVVTINGVAVS